MLDGQQRPLCDLNLSRRNQRPTMKLEPLDTKITQKHAIVNLKRVHGHYTKVVESSTTTQKHELLY